MHTSRPLARLAGRCVVFALPLVALCGWLERGLSAMENSYSAKRHQLESIESTVEAIVTGSSGALNGIDPERFGVPAYNLANGSQTLHYDIEIVTRYLDRMPKLRLLILAQSYSSLGLDLGNTREAWRGHFYSVFWGVPLEAPEHRLVVIQNHSYIALYTPRIAVQAALGGFRLTTNERFRDNGWNRPGPPTATRHAEGMSPEWTRLRVQGHKDGMRPETARRNIARVEALARVLRARGVALALVWIPVSAEYTKAFGAVSVREQRQAQESLAAMPNVRFFDYSSDARFGPDDFVDADHLALAGAVKFSDILATEVVTPLLGKDEIGPRVHP